MQSCEENLMQNYSTVMFGALIAVAAAQGMAEDAPVQTLGAIELAQNTGAANRTLGNGSMGLGEGIDRLQQPKNGETEHDTDERRPQRYDQSAHGDNDTDMEHRQRPTLGDHKDE